MDQESIVADIEQRAFRAGVSIHAVCKRADIAASTFSRWKRTAGNPEPTSATTRSIRALYDALAAIESESNRKRRRRAA